MKTLNSGCVRRVISVRAARWAYALLLPALAAGCSETARSAAAQPSAPAGVDVVELSASDATQRMAAGTLTSRALTQAYLDRIAQLDDAGPRLNAVIEVNPKALAEAEALDTERRSGKVRGPLHGIPVLVKDNIDVVGMVNSAGSLALAEHRPAKDAFIAARLRDAGAVILGKANLSEWANFRSTRSTSGWSSRGGQTKNPYVLDRNPCGSSSGTGTAISASLATVGVGTETDGSILCPAAVNGLVGLKPTVGIVSRSGIIPISASQDTAGPMGRTVHDVALLMNVLAAVDPADPASSAASKGIQSDYTRGLDVGGLKGRRLGVLRQGMGAHPEVDAAAERALATLRAQGAQLVDVKIASYNKWNEAEFTLMLYEFKDGLNAYLQRSGAPHRSLEALIAYNKAHAKEVMPFFGQEIFEQAQKKGPLTDAEYIKARDSARRLARQEGILATLESQKLDALVAPTLSPAWPTDLVLGDHFVGPGYGLSMAAVAGTPSITVPMGDAFGLPVGLTLMGRPYSEAELLALAYAFEQATRSRKAPQFVPTLTLAP